MSLSQMQQSEDLHDQMTILVGSAIRLLCGVAGVFVISNEAFDPQSTVGYTLYRLSESALPILLASISEDVGAQCIAPNPEHPLVVSTLPPGAVAQLEFCSNGNGGAQFIPPNPAAPAPSTVAPKAMPIERCSLLLHDQAGVLGVLHYLRPAGTRSCFEQGEGFGDTLHLFIAQLAASLHFALKSQSLVNEQRSTFISVISHELQTPIAIIKGYASTLTRSDAALDGEALHSRLLTIEEEADRLNKMVGNLLYASRIEAGGLQMEVVSLDLASLVEGVVRRLSAKSQDVTVTLDLPANLPTVMADRDRIEEVLQNLLDNAIKYSPRRRDVTVACRATGEEVIVSISDLGMGIAVRDQVQIFDRFHRVSNRTTLSTPGAGLGLYICRAIVEAHGGHIWVESTLHEGSTFSFSLPRVEKAHLPMVVF